VSESQAWTENRAPSGQFALPTIRELVRYKDVAFFLAWRDLKVRYKQTLFGVGWAVLQPVVGAAIFTVALGRFTGVPSDGLPYAVFVFAGFILWTYLSNSVTEAATSLVQNESLVSKVYFPRILAPLAGVLPYLLDLALSLPLLLGLLVLHDVLPGLQVVLLPIWILGAGVLSFGIGAFFAALNVKYRDVRQALPFVVQTWLFASPVLYPSSLAEGTLRWVYALNPAVGLLDGFRWSALDGPPPPIEDLGSLIAGTALVVVGLMYFLRGEREFADHI
jgi:lipopolysaccharide transport system permease protein